MNSTDEKDLFITLYEQARYALRHWGADEERFYDAMRGLDEIVDKIKLKIERGELEIQQMSDYKRILTSAEVFAVIRARHPDMVVFRSYSDPDNGLMHTSYCFKGGDYPVIEVHTTWAADPKSSGKWLDAQHEYWLCVPLREDA